MIRAMHIMIEIESLLPRTSAQLRRERSDGKNTVHFIDDMNPLKKQAAVRKGRKEIKAMPVLKLETHCALCRKRRKAILGQGASYAKSLNKGPN